MSIAIKVENISKNFRLWTDPPRSVKKLLIDLLLGRVNLGTRNHFCALKPLSFEIQKGEFVGIMGRNGAGKSTLLKLISGIYAPSSGTIEVHGRIAPLIELGAGFHGDLSGRENIYLNAAILGFGRAAAQAALPKIIEFSELGEFIDMPVRTYSSGMNVRLGFSTAVHLEAPILLLDEVLAVGDMGFQEKCLKKVQELHQEGRTIIFITHDASAVQSNCSRCIVIDHHEKVFDGDVERGVQLYTELFHPPSKV